jgi:hypothetical protein
VVNAFRGKSSYFVHQQYSRGTPLDTEMTQGGSNLVDKVSLVLKTTPSICGLVGFSYKRLHKLGDLTATIADEGGGMQCARACRATNPPKIKDDNPVAGRNPERTLLVGG